MDFENIRILSDCNQTPRCLPSDSLRAVATIPLTLTLEAGKACRREGLSSSRVRTERGRGRRRHCHCHCCCAVIGSRGPLVDLLEKPFHLHLLRRHSRERRGDLHKVPSPGALQLGACPQDMLQVLLLLPTMWARRVCPLDPFPGFPKQWGATTP
jgi:hypothetical protein